MQDPAVHPTRLKLSGMRWTCSSGRYSPSWTLRVLHLSGTSTTRPATPPGPLEHRCLEGTWATFSAQACRVAG